MTVGLLQLIARSYQDNILTKNPSVTFFKYSYKTQPLFYKEERQKKNIKLNWNNNFPIFVLMTLEFLILP